MSLLFSGNNGNTRIVRDKYRETPFIFGLFIYSFVYLRVFFSLSIFVFFSFFFFFTIIRWLIVKSRFVPNRGIASETWGRVSATRFRNTVSDSKMVTPETIAANRAQCTPFLSESKKYAVICFLHSYERKSQGDYRELRRFLLLFSPVYNYSDNHILHRTMKRVRFNKV